VAERSNAAVLKCGPEGPPPFTRVHFVRNGHARTDPNAPALLSELLSRAPSAALYRVLFGARPLAAPGPSCSGPHARRRHAERLSYKDREGAPTRCAAIIVRRAPWGNLRRGTAARVAADLERIVTVRARHHATPISGPHRLGRSAWCGPGQPIRSTASVDGRDAPGVILEALAGHFRTVAHRQASNPSNTGPDTCPDTFTGHFAFARSLRGQLHSIKTGLRTTVLPMSGHVSWDPGGQQGPLKGPLSDVRPIQATKRRCELLEGASSGSAMCETAAGPRVPVYSWGKVRSDNSARQQRAAFTAMREGSWTLQLGPSSPGTHRSSGPHPRRRCGRGALRRMRRSGCGL